MLNESTENRIQRVHLLCRRPCDYPAPCHSTHTSCRRFACALFHTGLHHSPLASRSGSPVPPMSLLTLNRFTPIPPTAFPTPPVPNPPLPALPLFPQDDHLQSTIGVDFKVKMMNSNGKRVKTTVWDTAGQERFRTLTSSYYRGAHGILLVYDVSRRETFDALNQWLSEVAVYTPNDGRDVVKLLVGNKVDKEERTVSKREGEAWARSHGMLFIESSAKTKVGIQQVFQEVVHKVRGGTGWGAWGYVGVGTVRLGWGELRARTPGRRYEGGEPRCAREFRCPIHH